MLKQRLEDLKGLARQLKTDASLVKLSGSQVDFVDTEPYDLRLGRHGGLTNSDVKRGTSVATFYH
jgi:hypothetical protein